MCTQEAALTYVHTMTNETNLVVDHAHILRQCRDAGSSALFGPHRDNHDNEEESLLKFTMVIGPATWASVFVLLVVRTRVVRST